MKKKFDWNAPMSRKDYMVVGVGVFAFYVIFYTIWIVKLFKDDIKMWLLEKYNKIFRKEDSKE